MKDVRILSESVRAEYMETLIRDGRAKVLTLDEARGMPGKNILYYFQAYLGNMAKVGALTIPERIPTELEWSASVVMPGGYSLRQVEEQNSPVGYYAAKAKRVLVIPVRPWKDNFVFKAYLDSTIFPVPTFTATNIDRPVFFIPADGQEEDPQQSPRTT